MVFSTPKNKLLLATTFLFMSAQLWAFQTATHDSLMSLIAGSDEDSTQARWYLELYSLSISDDIALAQSYAEQALVHSQTVSDKGRLHGQAWSALAEVYAKRSENDSTRIAVEKCLSFAGRSGDSTTYVGCLRELGVIQSRQGEQKEALLTLNRANDIAERKGYLDTQLSILNELGRHHIGLGNTAESIAQFEKALSIADELDYHDQVAKLCINLSIAHDSIAIIKSYVDRAITIAEEHDLKRISAYAYNAASTYYTWYVNQPDSAIWMAKKAQHIADEIGESALSDRLMKSIAEAYREIDVDSAIHYYAILMSRPAEYDYSEELYRRQLAYLYHKKRNHDLAFSFLDSSYTLAEARYRQNLEEQVAEANAKYETEKKEAELAQQQLTIEKQQGTQRLLIGGAVGGLTLLGSIFFGYSQRVKRKEREKELALQRERDRADDLAALTKAKTDFFNNINHELRTPLSLVLAPLQDARKKVKNVDLQNDIDMAIKNSKRLVSLTDEIMDLAKLDNGKLKVEKSDLHLSTFIQRVFFSFSSLAESRGISQSLDVDLPDDFGIHVDVPKLEKILNNLISNAIKYSESGDSITLEMDRSLLEKESQLSIRIIDTGLGIPQDEIDHIFDRYYQSSVTLQSAGTGIGLAFVKELCELLGGVIKVESRVGKGSMFSIVLPVEQVTVKSISIDESEASSILELIPPLQIEGARPKILIVEDNPDMSTYLKSLLSPQYDCRVALNGREALSWLKQERYDLISSDIMMPEMDGMTFRAEVNKHVAWRNIPFIMLTARAMEEDKLDAFQLGIDDYITKPFSADEYRARVYSLLKNKIARAEEVEVELSPEEDLVKRAKSLVIEHLSDSSYRVNELAADLNYSTRQLGRKLKKSTGLTPVEFILELRLLKAYDLLKSRRYSTVNEVRYEIGIDSHSYFTTKFKERFGISPSEVGSSDPF